MAREFPRADLVGRVTRRFASAGLDPSVVGLEITETSSMHEFAAVGEQIQRLIDMGIELWLDDFGTGHSSLEWLSHLPLHGETPCQSIVTRVIEMAHDLGLRVAAEEIETREQRDWLTDRGCDLLQGFFFYAAMPAEELPGALAGAPVPAPSRERP